jgi:ABC-type multidrug transport system fused ATPase/permease subunit
MPNKYEREIEEILRNMERTEPKASFGQKFSGRLRRRSDRGINARRRSPLSFNLNLGMSAWLLIIAWVAALIAGGYAFAADEQNLFTGILAIVAMISLIIVVLLPFFSRRYPVQSSRYGNVTPLRRNPLSSLSTRWNLFILKLRYRRRRDH